MFLRFDMSLQVHLAAIDVYRLPGDEVTIGCDKEHQRAQQIFGHHLSLDGAGIYRGRARAIPLVVAFDRAAFGQANSNGVDLDIFVAKFTRMTACQTYDRRL